MTRRRRRLEAEAEGGAVAAGAEVVEAVEAVEAVKVVEDRIGWRGC